MATRGKVALAAALVVTMAAMGCSSGDPSATGGTTPGSATDRGSDGSSEVFTGAYRATIRRTTDGVAHINGPNIQSVTFGQGYASGEDYACTLGDQMLKIQGRRAEVLGPGDNDANINSDFAWRAIGIDARARKDFTEASADVQDLMAAFSAGWNKHLAEVGADKVKGWCAEGGWLTPITAEDLYAYARSIALNASSTQVARYLGSAEPPAAAPAGTEQATAAVAPVPWPRSAEPLASNGWAIGKDRTESGGGMLVANPHFPWEGELRFWEVQLTVDGQSSIYGAQLEGLPGVGIGFTDQFGWTHTVSAGNRFTAYTLSLVPGKPTTYKYDDTEKEMTSRDETVRIKGADGTTTEQTRTLWFSEYGPILDFPGVGWSEAMTTTYRDANIDNDEFIDQYFAMDQAKSFDEFKEAHATFQGVPLFNTIAVSRDGRAWYADTSATPNLSPEAIRKYEDSLRGGGMAKIAADSGAVLFDGSDSTYQWVDAPGARDPGLVPYDEMPQVERSDYVFNANDSFWLNHAGTTLDGDYSPFHGRQDTARSPRTRENAVVLDDTTAAGPAGEGGKFTLDELRGAALLNHGYTSRALKDAVVARCTGAGSVTVPDLMAADGTSVALPAATVDIAEACAVLDGWDGAYDLDRRGAALWRELMARFEPAAFTAAGELWATPFDPADPVGTPSGLATAAPGGTDPVLVNLARAVQVFDAAGVAVDAPLGDVQFADRAGERVPIHGGTSIDGTTNIVSYSGGTGSTEPFPKRGATFAPRSALTSSGYQVNYGTSFLLALEFSSSGPKAYAFLTYGNTGDRTSPWYSSQTRKFSAKDWRPVRFTEADIASDPDLTSKDVSS